MLSLALTYAVRGVVTTLATLTTKEFFSKVKDEVNAVHASREARRSASESENTPSTNAYGPEVK